MLTPAPPVELISCLDHLLDAAGNPGLLTPGRKRALAEHAAGNYRVMMITADELLAVAADRELPRLDEKLYIEVSCPPSPARTLERCRTAGAPVMAVFETKSRMRHPVQLWRLHCSPLAAAVGEASPHSYAASWRSVLKGN